MARERKTFAALGAKLRQIRAWKMLTQTETLRIVLPTIAATKPHLRAMVSQWELGTREPPRDVLIRYASFAEINLEELMVDENRLPQHITMTANRGGALVAGRVKKRGYKKSVTKEMATLVVDYPNAETEESAQADGSVRVESSAKTGAVSDAKNIESPGDAVARTSARFEKSGELWFTPIEDATGGKSDERKDGSRDIEEDTSERENKTEDEGDKENEIDETTCGISSTEIESDIQNNFDDDNENAHGAADLFSANSANSDNDFSGDFSGELSGDDSRNVSNDDATASESAIFGLPAQTLDQLHDVHLKLLLRLPRKLRSSLTVSHIVDIGIKLVLLDYEKRNDGGLLGERVRKIKRDSAEKKSKESSKKVGSELTDNQKHPKYI